tara:strand:- start:4460 stop:5545 length:1086 start_codon:yes stop_codon:yes gene_type:complete
MNSILNNLFVLELANNHLGSVERGLKIIREHSQVIRFHNLKAAIKLQFRDVSKFVHNNYKDSDDRYIKKTLSTKLNKNEFEILVNEIKNVGCIPMATPFDEASVDLCEYFKFPIIKIASSDINDWPLIEKIAKTSKPVILSTGGASEKDIDDIVNYFKNRRIEIAINHCVSLYPTPDEELNLNQIDYLKKRFPDTVIGFSTHEYTDWSSSMLISYAKGARTWERHIDIDYQDVKVSKYCSLPSQMNEWFNAFKLAEIMNGPDINSRRIIKNEETEYLDKLVRGIYVKKNIPKNFLIKHSDFNEFFYLAIPLNKGQLSCREILNGVKINKNLQKDQMLTIDDIDSSLKDNDSFKKFINNRGH